jgi:hypothetical protein
MKNICKVRKYVFADLRKFSVHKSQKILGPQIRKVTHLPKHANLTISTQICGFAICVTYLRTANTLGIN